MRTMKEQNPHSTKGASMQNNHTPSTASEAVTYLKRAHREMLKRLGYMRLSINMFIKNDEVVILKSMVEDTNPRELDFISTTDEIMSIIAPKSITIQAFVRSSYSDMSIRVSRHVVEFTESAEQNLFWSTIRSNQNFSYRNAIMPLRACNNIIYFTNNEVA